MTTTTKGRETARPVPTFDHLKKKKPVEIHEWIPLDDSTREALAEAENELQRAELIGDDEERLAKAKAALDTAREAARDNSVEVVFRSIGRSAYEALVRAHPPTEKQIEEHKKRFGVPAEFNPETLLPELVSASCAQPVMTPEQVTELVTEHDWNQAEVQMLFELAISVNTQRRVANLAF